MLLALVLQEDPTAAAPAANSSALLEMVHNSGPVAFAVLILLLLCSIFSWSIMISKWFELRSRGQPVEALSASL